MRMADTGAGRKALGAAAAAGVRHMAHRFIVAETPHAARHLVRRLWHQGVATSVDLLGEATVTAAEADRYAARCADALERLAAIHEDLPHRPHLEHDRHGPIPRANLSVKVSALTPLLRPDAPERGMRDAGARLRELLRHARRLGAHLHIDMESVDSLEAVTDLVLELLAEPEFRDGPSAGVVLQAYLRDSPAAGRAVHRLGGRDAARAALVVRLVKGAYWDHEVVEARQHGWTHPGLRGQGRVRPQLRGAHPPPARGARPTRAVRLAIASHNLRSVSHAIADNRRLGADDRRPRAAGPARPRRRPAGRAAPPRGSACASTARSATSSPGMAYLVEAAAGEHRATSPSSTSRRAARRSRSCWRAP